jgi:hypothetical protein
MGRIVSHIKIKALNMAQVEFVDLLGQVSRTYQRFLTNSAAPASGGSKLTMPRA